MSVPGASDVPAGRGPRASEAPAAADGPGPGEATPRSAARRRTTQVAVAVLCLVLGFGVITQIRQTQDDVLAGMRQDDLVRLLDELNQRNDELLAEQEELRADLAELRSSTSSQEAARQAAEEQAQVQGVLAGTLPVRGPGVRVTIRDPDGGVRAQHLVTILEELRNAGAEAIEISGRRLTADSWLLDGPEGSVVVDGAELSEPYRWTAVGDPGTLAPALSIPGGAVATVRNAGATVDVVELDEVEITAVKELRPPEHATPVPREDLE